MSFTWSEWRVEWCHHGYGTGVREGEEIKRN